MASTEAQLVAVMVAFMAVTVGSLLGGNTITATLDMSTGVAIIGLAVSLSNAIAGEILELRGRFGADVLWAVLLLF